MRASHFITEMLSKKPVYVLLLGMTFFSVIHADSRAKLDGPKIVTALKNSYGDRAAKRGSAWFKLMQPDVSLSENDILKKVNRFFNLFQFVDDIKLWGVNNYWATPVEFIGANGGGL